jgi:hypothetical protein
MDAFEPLLTLGLTCWTVHSLHRDVIHRRLLLSLAALVIAVVVFGPVLDHWTGGACSGAIIATRADRQQTTAFPANAAIDTMASLMNDHEQPLLSNSADTSHVERAAPSRGWTWAWVAFFVYLGGVVLLQSVFRALTEGESQLAVAGATLLVATKRFHRPLVSAPAIIRTDAFLF